MAAKHPITVEEGGISLLRETYEGWEEVELPCWTVAQQ